MPTDISRAPKPRTDRPARQQITEEPKESQDNVVVCFFVFLCFVVFLVLSFFCTRLSLAHAACVCRVFCKSQHLSERMLVLFFLFFSKKKKQKKKKLGFSIFVFLLGAYNSTLRTFKSTQRTGSVLQKAPNCFILPDKSISLWKTFCASRKSLKSLTKVDFFAIAFLICFFHFFPKRRGTKCAK